MAARKLDWNKCTTKL